MAGEWGQLFDRCAGASVHQSPEWGLSFLRPDDPDGVMAVVARRDGRMVGLLALRRRRIGPLRIWSPLGTGMPGILHPLIEGADAAIAQAIMEELRRARGVRMLLAEDVVCDRGDAAGWLAAAEATGWASKRVPRTTCWISALQSDFEAFLAANKSAKSRQTLRRQLKQTWAGGNVAVERHDGEEVGQPVLDRLAALQERSWMKRRGAAVLGMPFYSDLLLSQARAGRLQARIMTVGGRDATFTLGLVAHGRYHLGWLAFDLEFESLGVGRALMAETIRDCCAAGLTEVNFGHGDAEYKRYWGTREERISRVLLTRGLLGAAARAAMPFAERMRSSRRVRGLVRRLRGRG